jgi:hypothetical protein
VRGPSRAPHLRGGGRPPAEARHLVPCKKCSYLVTPFDMWPPFFSLPISGRPPQRGLPPFEIMQRNSLSPPPPPPAPSRRSIPPRADAAGQWSNCRESPPSIRQSCSPTPIPHKSPPCHTVSAPFKSFSLGPCNATVLILVIPPSPWKATPRSCTTPKETAGIIG